MKNRTHGYLRDAARRLRKDQTEAEKAIWAALRNRGLDDAKFRRQEPVGPYVADFLCAERRLIVEIDGGQHAQNAADLRRDAELQSQGYDILRFWNTDVLGNLEGVLMTISDRLRQGASPRATALTSGSVQAADAVTLTYEARYRRRGVLRTDAGEEILLDLAEATELREGQALVLEDGRHVAIRAAVEPLTEVRGENLARLAWHIGNRHTPAQVEAGRILIQRDHVLEEMLRGLGAQVAHVAAPFSPEGGAYGHGRTHGHSHSHDPHEDPNAHIPHRHAHAHGHAHD